MRSVKYVIVPPVAVPPLALAILATAVSFAPIPDGPMSAQLDGRGPHGRYYRVGAVQPWLRYAHIWDPATGLDGGRIEHFDGPRSAAHLVLVSLVWGSVIVLWPRGDRERFQALAKTLQEQLSGVKVYKVGAEAERQVHVVGKAPDGRLLARDDEARPVARPPTEGALAGGAPGPKPTQAGL